MKGWKETILKDTSQNLSGSRIHIHTPNDKTEWVKPACNFWCGKLTELTPVQCSPTAEVFSGRIPNINGSFYFKKFLMRDSRADRLKHVIRASRGKRALLYGQAVSGLGFHAPVSVCLIEEKRFGIVTGSGLITEAIKNAPSISDMLAQKPQTTESIREKQRLIYALGTEVGTWHGSGICHGDMRAGNVLCRKADDSFAFYWLDNEGTRMTRSMTARARNLTQANMPLQSVTAHHRLRFWKAYIKAAGYDTKYANRLLSEVIRRSIKRWSKRGWEWPNNPI